MTRTSVVARAAPDAVVALAQDPDPAIEFPPRLRASLERVFGTDLSDVQLRVGPKSEELVRRLDAEAVTCGGDIFLGRNVVATTAPGARVVAHEVVHALQQRGTWSRGRRAIVLEDPIAERTADRLATAHERETGGPPGHLHDARPVRHAPGLVFQRHASWEHRLLGDADPTDLDAIANNAPNRQALLIQLSNFLHMWAANPDSVTAQMIATFYPNIRTTTLTGSNLLVTYGELNTLPDYLADPGAMDQLPREIMLPILQAVRQEGYNRIQAMQGWPLPTQFAGAVAINTGWSMLDLLTETRAINNLTWDVGPNHVNHYTALVGRNACHFAPYSWYRWQMFYTAACTSAAQAHGATDPVQKGFFTHQAWMNLGYADHFLEDSFAAGHLVNKTLIMQWFLEWAADKWYVPVADWVDVKNLTYPHQPNISAPQLYDMSNPGSIRDPQTVNEMPTLARRIAASGVQADGPISQSQAYQYYWEFMNSTVTQSASGALHDYFNANSLWVASVDQPKAYQIWGDDTMLNGGAGVGIAGTTAHLSQRSIADILQNGVSPINAAAIMSRFPTQIVDPTTGRAQAIKDWQYSPALKALAYQQFPDLHYWVLRAYPRIGYISVDGPQAASAAVGVDPRRAVPTVPRSAASTRA